jgi:hypothetical protein
LHGDPGGLGGGDHQQKRQLAATEAGDEVAVQCTVPFSAAEEGAYSSRGGFVQRVLLVIAQPNVMFDVAQPNMTFGVRAIPFRALSGSVLRNQCFAGPR